jgi:hypothetical protein
MRLIRRIGFGGRLHITPTPALATGRQFARCRKLAAFQHPVDCVDRHTPLSGQLSARQELIEIGIVWVPVLFFSHQCPRCCNAAHCAASEGFTPQAFGKLLGLFLKFFGRTFKEVIG